MPLFAFAGKHLKLPIVGCLTPHFHLPQTNRLLKHVHDPPRGVNVQTKVGCFKVDEAAKPNWISKLVHPLSSLTWLTNEKKNIFPYIDSFMVDEFQPVISIFQWSSWRIPALKLTAKGPERVSNPNHQLTICVFRTKHRSFKGPFPDTGRSFTFTWNQVQWRKPHEVDDDEKHWLFYQHLGVFTVE